MPGPSLITRSAIRLALTMRRTLFQTCPSSKPLRLRAVLFAMIAGLALTTPLSAKDSLGVFSDWGAFRDTAVPRCYAIAMPAASRLQRDFEPFATIGTWPRRGLRGPRDAPRRTPVLER